MIYSDKSDHIKKRHCISILAGLFFVSMLFGSFVNVAWAYWSCAGGYETHGL